MLGFEGCLSQFEFLHASPKVKVGCCTFTIHPDGGVSGYKHPPGFFIKSPISDSVSCSPPVFFSCTNTSKVFKWGIGFATLNTPFHKRQPGPIRDTFLILVRGLVDIRGYPQICYHQWKGGEECLNFISREEAVDWCRFCFEEQPTFTPPSNIHIEYVNLLSGLCHEGWVRARVPTFVDNGVTCVMAAEQPDSFSCKDPFPSARPLAKMITLSHTKMKNGDLRYLNSRDVDKACGNQKIYQPISPTNIYFCVKDTSWKSFIPNIRDTYLVPLPTESTTRQEFVPLSRSATNVR